MDGFNSLLSVFGISPIKIPNQQGEVKKAHYGKRKFESMKEKLSSSFRDVLSSDISNSCKKCDHLSK